MNRYFLTWGLFGFLISSVGAQTPGTLLRNGDFQDDWITLLPETKNHHWCYSSEFYNRRDFNPDAWICKGSWQWLNADAPRGQRKLVLQGPEAQVTSSSGAERLSLSAVATASFLPSGPPGLMAIRRGPARWTTSSAAEEPGRAFSSSLFDNGSQSSTARAAPAAPRATASEMLCPTYGQQAQRLARSPADRRRAGPL